MLCLQCSSGDTAAGRSGRRSTEVALHCAVSAALFRRDGHLRRSCCSHGRGRGRLFRKFLLKHALVMGTCTRSAPAQLSACLERHLQEVGVSTLVADMANNVTSQLHCAPLQHGMVDAKYDFKHVKPLIVWYLLILSPDPQSESRKPLKNKRPPK